MKVMQVSPSLSTILRMVPIASASDSATVICNLSILGRSSRVKSFRYRGGASDLKKK